MKERPIPFNSLMVRAILKGHKTQTRRVIKPQPYSVIAEDVGWGHNNKINKVLGRRELTICTIDDMPTACPYGVPGDQLWVKETFATGIPGYKNGTSYKADHDDPRDDGPANPVCWKSSRFMPRSVSRILLEVTGVKVERVQDISHDDVISEGGPFGYSASSDEDFATLWNSIYAKPKPIYCKRKVSHYVSYPWNTIQEHREYRNKPWFIYGNPWVWVVEFRRMGR